MNPSPIQLSLPLIPARRNVSATATRVLPRPWLPLLSSLLLTASLAAQDRTPPNGAPPATREPVAGAPRGERQPGADSPRGERRSDPVPGAPRGERQPGADSPRGERRSEWPAEINLTDVQQAKVNEINDSLAAKQAELSKQRDAILTDEQKAAHTAAREKLRDGSASRQEAADLLAAALKLTPDQKTQLEALEVQMRQLFQETTAQKTALLTEEQRTTLRKLTIANNVARIFTVPGGITVSEEQKTALLGLQTEFGSRLADLTEAQAVILTDERRAARDAAAKEIRESGKDREAAAAAMEAALKMTDAEKKQLAETEQTLRELNQQIHDRMMTLLTPEQKAELEQKFGAARSRN